MTEYDPKAVRYIKLGPGGAWARDAIATGMLPFSYRMVDHDLCAAGDWDDVRDCLVAEGWKAGSARRGANEIRDFYELGEDCLWVTFADGHLWWAFAAPEVIALESDDDAQPARRRQVIGGWRRTALDGSPLSLSTLSSALTRTGSYRMTICRIEREDYLLRRIRGEADPLSEEARALQARLREIAARLARDLDWRDFEILVDLILTRAGWRRLSAVGDGEVDIDLLLEHPTTGERAWVQIKTGTSQTELEDYLERFEADGGSQRFFYICHSSKGALSLPAPRPHLHLWQAEDVAAQAIEAGLFDWLIARHA